MKTLNFEQMEALNGGSKFDSYACNTATGTIGIIYYFAIAGAVGGPKGMIAGMIVGGLWSAGLSTLIC